MTKKITIKTKILTYLREHPSARVKEIPPAIGIKYEVISAYIGRMNKEGFIKKVGYGKYSPTEKGLSHLTESSSEETQLIFNTPNTNPEKVLLNEIDLENIDTILLLKQRYGKRKLLSIIDKIRKVIE